MASFSPFPWDAMKRPSRGGLTFPWGFGGRVKKGLVLVTFTEGNSRWRARQPKSHQAVNRPPQTSVLSGLSSINRPGRGEGVVGYNGFWRPLTLVMFTPLTRTPAHHSLVTPSIRSYRGSSSFQLLPAASSLSRHAVPVPSWGCARRASHRKRRQHHRTRRQ